MKTDNPSLPAGAASDPALPHSRLYQQALSRTEVFALIKKGELASLQIGRRRRVPRHALDDYIAAQLALAAGESTSADSEGACSGRR